MRKLLNAILEMYYYNLSYRDYRRTPVYRQISSDVIMYIEKLEEAAGEFMATRDALVALIDNLPYHIGMIAGRLYVRGRVVYLADYIDNSNFLNAKLILTQSDSNNQLQINNNWYIDWIDRFDLAELTRTLPKKYGPINVIFNSPVNALDIFIVLENLNCHPIYL